MPACGDRGAEGLWAYAGTGTGLAAWGQKKKKKASGIGTWLPGHYSLLAPPINCLLEGQSRAEELILVEGGESLLFAVRYILDY